MASTAESIIELARNILREEAGSDLPVIADSFMLTAVSDGNLKWARAFRKSGSAPVVFQREKGFDLAAETAIDDSDGISTSDTTITVYSTTGYDSSGAAVIWDDGMPDIFTYTGVTATTFTGVSGLSFAHEDGDQIQPLYKLPTNFGHFRESPKYGDGAQLNGVPLYYRDGPPDIGQFSLYDDGTDKFLWLPRQSTNTASIFYDKASTTIDSVDDTVDVPTEYQFFLVWHVVAFCLMGRDTDMNAMVAAQSQSNSILQDALIDRNVGKKIRPKPLGRRPIDYIKGYPIFR